MPENNERWVQEVERFAQTFANDYGTIYRRTERQLSAAFEIGCFHSIIDYFSEFSEIFPENLKNNEYKYLTSPNGNPSNFSYVSIRYGDQNYQLRQQVRIQCPLNSDINFTPDFVLFKPNAEIEAIQDGDYANGTRRFFFVKSDELVSLFECKSLNPFPELLVSFLGMVFSAFPSLSRDDIAEREDLTSRFLAPSLFVGGSARGIHLRMVEALTTSYPINIFLGLHYGDWGIQGDDATVNKLSNPE